jgi:hypothetical protein
MQQTFGDGGSIGLGLVLGSRVEYIFTFNFDPSCDRGIFLVKNVAQCHHAFAYVCILTVWSLFV